MKNIITLYSSLFWAAIIGSAQPLPQVAKNIDSIFASHNAQKPGAAVADVKDGNVIFQKGYGMANLSHCLTRLCKSGVKAKTIYCYTNHFAICNDYARCKEILGNNGSSSEISLMAYPE